MKNDCRRSVRVRVRATRWAWWAASAGLLGLGAPSWGQCEPMWQPGDGVRGVYNNGKLASVRELLAWDPDGPGPHKPVLVLGFQFDTAGKTPCRNIAQYDGTTLMPLGAGVNGQVFALGEFENGLIAGGHFTEAGDVPVSSIARWDGLEWSDLGGGVTIEVQGQTVPGYVHDCARWGDDLVAVGSFSQAGGVPAMHIASWDGRQWGPIGGGLSSKAWTVESYQGDLYVAGGFVATNSIPVQGIARWNGAEWDDVGGGTTHGQIMDLCVHDGLLYAAGEYLDIASGAVTGGLAVWDGAAWSRFSSVDAPPSWSIAFYGGLPSLTGPFADGVSVWNGQAWKELVKSGQFWNGFAVAEFNSELVFGGEFHSLNGVGAMSIARWDGSIWQPLYQRGMDAVPSAMLGREDGLYIAGSLHAAGDQQVEGVVRWNGEDWTPIGTGLFSKGGANLHGLAEYQGDLCITGSFQNAGSLSEPLNGIARWDGVAWRSLGAGIKGTQAAPGPMIEHDGWLVVGGSFTNAGNKPAINIARWDGAEWYALGKGLVGGSPGPSGVGALASVNGQLIAAGSFTTAGSKPALNIAAWDGLNWSPLGPGLAGTVISLAEYQNALIAGETRLDGNEFSVRRWNGSTWEHLTTNIDRHVYALTIHADRLIAGGFFDDLHGLPANHLAQWDGSSWLPVPGGVNSAVTRVASWQSKLVVAGLFGRADDQVSVYFAHLGCTCQADCDHSGSLNIDDFVCFQTLYAIGEPSADCDGSGELDVEDFVCFQTHFAVGC